MKRLRKICIFIAAATMFSSCELIEGLRDFFAGWIEAPITITLTSKKYDWDNLVWTDYRYHISSWSHLGFDTINDRYVGERYVGEIEREFFLPDNIQVDLRINVFTDNTVIGDYCELNTRYTTEEIIKVEGEEMKRVFVDIDLYDLETGELDKLETEITGWVEYFSYPPNGIGGEFSFSVSDGDELILKMDGKFADQVYDSLSSRTK